MHRQGSREVGTGEALFDELPPAPSFDPIRAALREAEAAGLPSVAAVLRNLVSMPPATSVIANPVLHKQGVICEGREIVLRIRGFSVRGVLGEWEIVGRPVSPSEVVAVGLFGRAMTAAQTAFFECRLQEAVDRHLGRCPGGLSRGASLLRTTAEFAVGHRDAEPGVVIQWLQVQRKLAQKRRSSTPSISSARQARLMLDEMIDCHVYNVVGGCSAALFQRLLREHPTTGVHELLDAAEELMRSLKGCGLFEFSYACLLGRPPSGAEAAILERLGTIQIHHGSAGSNMVARYLAALHVVWAEDLFAAALTALDSARHFGAIHQMTDFVNELMPLSPQGRDKAIAGKVGTGGLPTFGHPEIAAAGRSDEIEQDPRSAIYLAPLLDAIDAGLIKLDSSQKERLGIARRIYQLAFVSGVRKADGGTLRLTPNTDFGAWCVQEALGIHESDRTLLTYVFRGFGWMMDVREQLQQKIIRPVIAPAPEIVPTEAEAVGDVIPSLVARMHERLATGTGFDRC